MNIKRIIMIAAAGLLSFAGAFLFVWLTKGPSAAVAQSAQMPADQNAAPKELPGVPQVANIPGGGTVVEANSPEQGMTETKLNDLALEMQEKLDEYNRKFNELTSQEERVGMVRDMLKKDLDNLKNLQVEVASAVSKLKQQQDELEKSVVRISEIERKNLQRTATIYDKMDAASASKIMINMYSNQQSNDAVRILNYMTEKKAAKLLESIIAEEPKLAAELCAKLKRIREDK